SCSRGFAVIGFYASQSGFGLHKGDARGINLRGAGEDLTGDSELFFCRLRVTCHFRRTAHQGMSHGALSSIGRRLAEFESVAPERYLQVGLASQPRKLVQVVIKVVSRDVRPTGRPESG